RQFLRLHPTHKHVRNGWVAYMAAVAAYMAAPSTKTVFLPPHYQRDQTLLRETMIELRYFFDHHAGTQMEPLARKLEDEVKRRLLEHELYVARFQLDRDRPEAAIMRLEAAHDTYPGIGLDAEVLFLLAITYLRIGEVELAREIFSELQMQHPDHHHGQQARLYLKYMMERYGPPDPNRERPDRSLPVPETPPQAKPGEFKDYRWRKQQRADKKAGKVEGEDAGSSDAVEAKPLGAPAKTPKAKATKKAEPETEAEPEEPPAPTGPPKRIFAKRFVVPVRAAPSRDADRIGYLRGGAVLMAKTAEPVGFERCAGGWFELTTGGYVCNGRMVTAFEGRRLPAARGRQPSREDVLPYEYGYVRRRVPMYRRPPNDEEAAEFEGYRIPGAETEEGSEGESEGGDASAMTDMASETSMAATMAEAAVDSAPADMASESAMADMVAAMVAEASAMRDVEPGTRETGTNLETSGGGEDEEEDEGPTLATLMGDPSSVVARWLMRGFFVSLDRDFRRGPRRYWRTQSNGFVPYTAIV
ncbi:MAG: outer membrane protein assembly factor BamD, partial [Myxococcales bacterium]|nr:outer membrane protein assembly factor BamD [Myxococcales bacterium]